MSIQSIQGIERTPIGWKIKAYVNNKIKSVYVHKNGNIVDFTKEELLPPLDKFGERVGHLPAGYWGTELPEKVNEIKEAISKAEAK